MDIVSNSPTTLRAIGKDEKWLQDWFMDEPARLGLGNVTIKAKELRHYTAKGGRLDVLAYNAALDTYYEIEIMLGECDADHGFRVLDYWARERLKIPGAKHVAVIIAEDLSGRYRTVLETLTQFLPLIAIELKTLVIGSGETKTATTFSVVFAQPDNLILRPADDPGQADEAQSLNDEATWEGRVPDFTANARSMFKLCDEKIGHSRIDFSAKSYIALKKGNRAWLPMWPRKDGFYIYLPGGPGGAADHPSDFYAKVKATLAELGQGEPSWSYTYNAGANPIAFNLASSLISHSKITELLSDAYSFA